MQRAVQVHSSQLALTTQATLVGCAGSCRFVRWAKALHGSYVCCSAWQSWEGVAIAGCCFHQSGMLPNMWGPLPWACARLVVSSSFLRPRLTAAQFCVDGRWLVTGWPTRILMVLAWRWRLAPVVWQQLALRLFNCGEQVVLALLPATAGACIGSGELH